MSVVTLQDRVAAIFCKLVCMDDVEQMRTTYTAYAAVLDEIGNAVVGGTGANEQAIPVRVSDLVEKITAKVAAITAVYTAKKGALQAELAAADNFEAAVAAYHATINTGLTDGSFKIDISNNRGYVVAVNPDTKPVPPVPVKQDMTSAQKKIAELDKKLAQAVKPLNDQVEVLGMTNAETVTMTVTLFRNALGADVPTVDQL